jgi:molecular chaperone GrpE
MLSNDEKDLTTEQTDASQVEGVEVSESPVEDSSAGADERVQELEASLVRVTADYANYQKRAEREKREWGVIAKISLLKTILPVLDDLDRAIEARQDQEDAEGWLLIQKNLTKALESAGVTPMDVAGDFDPVRHEALANVDSAEHKSGEVVEVLQKGYCLGDKIIRHARVTVAK